MTTTAHDAAGMLRASKRRYRRLVRDSYLRAHTIAEFCRQRDEDIAALRRAHREMIDRAVRLRSVLNPVLIIADEATAYDQIASQIS